VSSARTVPLGRVVIDQLAAHLAIYGPADDGSLFTGDVGRPLTYGTWKDVWAAAGAGFKTHDLRHYAASAAVTLGVYAHLWPGDDDRARTAG
jgi:integrase